MELFDIKKVNTAMERQFNQLCRSIDLTGTQASVLHILYQSSDKIVCQKDIENALGLTHPTVCSILDRLEKNGLIESECLLEDRRFHEIILTSKGKRYRKKVESIITEMHHKVFQGFSEKELHTLEVYINRLQENTRLNI